MSNTCESTIGNDAHDGASGYIRARYRELSTKMANGVSAEDLMEFLYWPDVVVAGEGLGQVYRGVDALLPLAREFVKQMGSDCLWTAIDPIISSGDLASSVAQVTCRYGGEQPDANYCALYVWQRRGEQWKVVHEQLCVGTAT
jgi:ketosteroid isomerase-like protein